MRSTTFYSKARLLFAGIEEWGVLLLEVSSLDINTIYFVTTKFVLTYLPILPIHEISTKNET
jgi:hypothetical protein